MKYLKAKHHNLYYRKPELREKDERVSYLSLDTDERFEEALVVCGVPINQRHCIQIIAVRGKPKTVHALFQMVNGVHVMTFDRAIIKRLYRLGYPIQWFPVEQEFIAKRREHLLIGEYLGKPKLIEIQRPNHD